MPLSLLGHDQRRAADPGDVVDHLAEFVRRCAAVVADPLRNRGRRALADFPAVGQVDTAHPGLRGERHEHGAGQLAGSALADVELVLGEHHDRAAFRRLVGQRRELCGVGQRGDIHPGHRQELGGLPVAHGDRAGLVEQQGVHVAGRLDGAAGHRDHVPLHEPVHAGDADRGQQRPDGGRDQRHDQRDQDDEVLRRAGVVGHRLQRDDRHHEDQRQRGEQHVQRHLVRRLLPGGTLDQADHPVDERLAGLGGDPHDDPVRQDLGAAGDRGPVTAGLADDRGRLAGDGALVDRGDTLDDVAVAGDDLAGLDDHEVADRQLGAGHLLLAQACRVSAGLPARPAAARRSPAWCAAASRPAPCRGPRRRPRPGWRTARSATARR